MSLLPILTHEATDVRRLGPVDREQAVAFLLEQATVNAFHLGWLHENDIVPRQPYHRYEFLGAFDGNRLVGVALLAAGTVCCLSAMSEETAWSIARRVGASAPPLRTVVGPRDATRAFWRGWASPGETPRLVHDQVLLSLRSRGLRYFPEPLLECAGDDDLEQVVLASLDMHSEETGLPIDDEERELFTRSVATRLRSGRVYVTRDEMTGHIAFKASISSWSPTAAQIEGVYVPRRFRQRGLARRGLSEMCRQLLYETGEVTLYVNEGNEPARRLYERLGFRLAARMSTLFLDAR